MDWQLCLRSLIHGKSTFKELERLQVSKYIYFYQYSYFSIKKENKTKESIFFLILFQGITSVIIYGLFSIIWTIFKRIKVCVVLMYKETCNLLLRQKSAERTESSSFYWFFLFLQSRWICNRTLFVFDV